MRLQHPRQFEKENEYNHFTSVVPLLSRSPFHPIRVASTGGVYGGQHVVTSPLTKNTALRPQQQPPTYYGDYASQQPFESVYTYVPRILDTSNERREMTAHKQTKSMLCNSILQDSSKYQDDSAYKEKHQQLKKIIGVKKSGQKPQKSETNLNSTYTQGLKSFHLQSISQSNLVLNLAEDRGNKIKVTLLNNNTSRNSSPVLQQFKSVQGTHSHQKMNDPQPINSKSRCISPIVKEASFYNPNPKLPYASPNSSNNLRNIINSSVLESEETDLTYTNTLIQSQRSIAHGQSGYLQSQRQYKLPNESPQKEQQKYQKEQQMYQKDQQMYQKDQYQKDQYQKEQYQKEQYQKDQQKQGSYLVGRLLFNEHFQQNRLDSSKHTSFNQLIDSQRQHQQTGWNSQLHETKQIDSGKKDESEIQMMVETLKQNILRDLQEVSKRYMSQDPHDQRQSNSSNHNSSQIQNTIGQGLNRFSFNQSEYSQFTNHLLSRQVERQTDQSLLRSSLTSQQSKDSGKKLPPRNPHHSQSNHPTLPIKFNDTNQQEGSKQTDIYNHLSEVINNGREFYTQIVSHRSRREESPDVQQPQQQQQQQLGSPVDKQTYKSNTPSFKRHLRQNSSLAFPLPSPLQLSFNMLPLDQESNVKCVSDKKPPLFQYERARALGQREFEESPVCIKQKRGEMSEALIGVCALAQKLVRKDSLRDSMTNLTGVAKEQEDLQLEREPPMKSPIKSPMSYSMKSPFKSPMQSSMKQLKFDQSPQSYCSQSEEQNLQFHTNQSLIHESPIDIQKQTQQSYQEQEQSYQEQEQFLQEQEQSYQEEQKSQQEEQQSLQEDQQSIQEEVLQEAQQHNSCFNDAEPEEEQIFLNKQDEFNNFPTLGLLCNLSEVKFLINQTEPEENTPRSSIVILRQSSKQPGSQSQEKSSLYTQEFLPEQQDVNTYQFSYLTGRLDVINDPPNINYQQKELNTIDYNDLPPRHYSFMPQAAAEEEDKRIFISTFDQQVVEETNEIEPEVENKVSQQSSASRQDRYHQLMKNFRDYRHTSGVKIENAAVTPRASHRPSEETSKDIGHISDFIIYQQRESMNAANHMRTPSLRRPNEFCWGHESVNAVTETETETKSFTKNYYIQQNTTEVVDSITTNPAASRLITFSQNDSDYENEQSSQTQEKSSVSSIKQSSIISQQVDFFQVGSGVKVRPYFKVNRRDRHACPSFREVLRERDRSVKKVEVPTPLQPILKKQSEREVCRKINFIHYQNSSNMDDSIGSQQTQAKLSFMEYKQRKG